MTAWTGSRIEPWIASKSQIGRRALPSRLAARVSALRCCRHRRPRLGAVARLRRRSLAGQTGTAVADRLRRCRCRREARPQGTADPIAELHRSRRAMTPAPPIAEDTDAPPAAARPPPAPVKPPRRSSANGATVNVDRPEAGAETPRRRRSARPPARRLCAARPHRHARSSTGWSPPAAIPDVRSARIADVAKRLADWPGQTLLRIRFEQALAREKPPADDRHQRASAARKPGLRRRHAPARPRLPRRRPARTMPRRSSAPSGATRKFPQRRRDARSARSSASLLTPADHKARMDRLLYDEQTADGAARRRPSRQEPAGARHRRRRGHQAARRPTRRSTAVPGGSRRRTRSTSTRASRCSAAPRRSAKRRR